MATPTSGRNNYSRQPQNQQEVTRNQYQPPPGFSPSNLRGQPQQQQQPHQNNNNRNLDYRLNPEHLDQQRQYHSQEPSRTMTPQRQQQQHQQIQEQIHQHQPELNNNNNSASAVLNESHAAYVPVIVIHGGASAATASVHDYRVALHEVLTTGQQMLHDGNTCVEIVAECCRIMEEIPFFNAGVGSVFNCDGEHELDASLMRGTDLAAGAVAAVKTVRNPILVAKKLLEKNASVLLTGDGAEKFARDSKACEIVTNSFFDTLGRKTQFEHTQNLSIRVGPEAKNNNNEATTIKKNDVSMTNENPNNININTNNSNAPTVSPIRRSDSVPSNNNNNNNNNNNEANRSETLGPSNSNYNNNGDDGNNSNNTNQKPQHHHHHHHHHQEQQQQPVISTGTVGVVCLDVYGNIAAGTSSGGLTNKPVGRVADTGVIGSGTYAHNDFAGVSCCGSGEILIRVSAGFNVVARMRFGKQAFFNACDQVIFEDLAGLGGVGGLIACDPSGNVAMPFSSTSMPRGFVQMNGPPRVAVMREPLKTLEELSEH